MDDLHISELRKSFKNVGIIVEFTPNILTQDVNLFLMTIKETVIKSLNEHINEYGNAKIQFALEVDMVRYNIDENGEERELKQKFKNNDNIFVAWTISDTFQKYLELNNRFITNIENNTSVASGRTVDKIVTLSINYCKYVVI